MLPRRFVLFFTIVDPHSFPVSSAYVGLKKGYLFMYNLVQFLGFSWIFVNMTVRLFILGEGLFKNKKRYTQFKREGLLQENEAIVLTEQ